jgi:hypothetical protein
MKIKILALLSILVVVVCSFVQSSSKDFFELKNGKTFTHAYTLNPERKHFSSRMSRGSYDQSGYEILIDSQYHIGYKKLKAAEGLHQSELEFNFCSANFLKQKDTVFIKVTTPHTKLYLLSLDQQKLLGTFGNKIEIEVAADDVNNKNCRTMISTYAKHLSLIALPKGVERNELFWSQHSPKTIGVFSYLKLKDSEGKDYFFSAGDYLLIGGNEIENLD